MLGGGEDDEGFGGSELLSDGLSPLDEDGGADSDDDELDPLSSSAPPNRASSSVSASSTLASLAGSGGCFPFTQRG